MSSIPASTLPNVTKEVARKFHSLRLKYLATRVASVLLGAMGAGLLLWLMLAVIDYYWEVHISWRQAAIYGGLGIALVLAGARLVRHARNSTVRAFVSTIERAFESFGQRIRTVLDAVDGKISGPPEMLAALGHQTLGRWETLVPSQIVPRRLLICCAAFFASTVSLVLVSMMGKGEWKTAMMRSLGYDIPYTRFSVEPGNITVLEGKPVNVQLTLIGRQNRDVDLHYRVIASEDFGTDKEGNSTEGSGSDQANWISHKLKANAQGVFAFEFGQAKDPIEYQFVTSVGATGVYRIQVRPLILATHIETHVTPPAYTGLEPRVFSSTEATVLERSAVKVHVETNYPLSSVQLEIGEKSTKLSPHEAQIESTGTAISFELPELPTAGSIHWKLNATGRDGTPMTTVKGRLRVREDAAPNIRWQDPQDEIQVHTLAELPMRVHISDDYGVTEAGIVFRVGDDEEFELTKRSIDELKDDSKVTNSLLLDEVFPLESFALSERDYVSYYAYAVDNRQWGPQRVETDVRYIDIKPLRQFFREDPSVPGANVGSRLIVQLEEIIRRERHLIRRTRKLENQGATALNNQIKTIDIMVEAQSELAGLTRFLAEFFLSRGNDDITALSQAEASMLQAADSLSAANLSLALSQEEDALRYLAEARRQLEVVLPNTTRAMQSQLRQLARQLQQKLRREVKQTEQQLADSLERIAAEQKQLAEQFSGSEMQNVNSSTSGFNGSNPNSLNTDRGGENLSTEAVDGSRAKQNDDQFQQQVELLERVEAIEEQLKDRLARSKLMASRMNHVKADMNDLAKMARAGQRQMYSEKGLDVSDQLREIAEQLQALSASEAVNRVASLRDMTLSMAERERTLVDALQHTTSMTSSPGTPSSGSRSQASQSANRVQSDGQGKGQPADLDPQQTRNNQAQTPADDPDSSEEVTPSETSPSNQSKVNQLAGNQSAVNQTQSNQIDGSKSEDFQTAAAGDHSQGNQALNATRQSRPIKMTQSLAARRLSRRAVTIADVLAAPSDVGDVGLTEVQETLEKFAEANQLSDRLNQSQQVGERFGDELEEQKNDGGIDSTQQQGGGSEATIFGNVQAMERAQDYADIAKQLDLLYRQLVSPRIARLRQLEQQATEFQQKIAGQGRKSEESTRSQIGSGEVEKLQRNLRQEGMDDLAELLESSAEDSEFAGQSRYGLGRNPNMLSRVEFVVRELRELIQEMILLEVAADRDMPVPAVYRSAVDGYFRAIAGESDE